jgi:hypothetical protein
MADVAAEPPQLPQEDVPIMISGVDNDDPKLLVVDLRTHGRIRYLLPENWHDMKYRH